MTVSLKQILSAFCLLFLAYCTHREIPASLGFEVSSLDGYWRPADSNQDYQVHIDSTQSHSGTRSLLVESIAPTVNAGMHGMAVYTIPVVDFKGKELTLSAYVKTTSNDGGDAMMGLKIFGDGWEQVQATKRGEINNRKDWKKYTIRLPLKDGARSISIAVGNIGPGKAWFDDIELLVDGRLPADAPRLDLLPALSDTAFLTGSRITIDTLTPQLQEHLVVLGKVWGFLKYYHPAVAAGRYNWDAALFRVLPGVISAKSKEARNEVLLHWVAGLEQGLPPGQRAKFDTASVTLVPDLGWLADKQVLGDALSAALENIRRTACNDAHIYVGLYRGGSPQFTNELPYDWMDYPDVGYRLLALYRCWNIIQYFCPNRELAGENWQGVLTHAIPAFVQAQSQEAYQLAAMKLIASIGDTHANLTGNTKGFDAFTGGYRLPVKAGFIEGNYTVTEQPVTASPLKVGDIIRKINGNTIQALQERLDPYISASNAEQKQWIMGMQIAKVKDTSLRLEIQRGRSVMELAVKAVRYYAGKPRPTPETLQLLKNNIGYCYLGTLKQEAIPDMAQRFLSTKGIIFDLRCYPEMVGPDLCRFFLTRLVPYVKWSFADLQRPGQFAIGNTNYAGGPNAFPYKGKVVVLVNEETVSRAEYVAMALKTIPNVTFVGCQTAGADGDVSEFTLPGNLKTRISGKGAYWPDGRTAQGAGIVPDLVVRPTLKGIQNGEDEQLNAAIALINK